MMKMFPILLTRHGIFIGPDRLKKQFVFVSLFSSHSPLRTNQLLPSVDNEVFAVVLDRRGTGRTKKHTIDQFLRHRFLFSLVWKSEIDFTNRLSYLTPNKERKKARQIIHIDKYDIPRSQFKQLFSIEIPI